MTHAGSAPLPARRDTGGSGGDRRPTTSQRILTIVLAAAVAAVAAVVISAVTTVEVRAADGSTEIVGAGAVAGAAAMAGAAGWAVLALLERWWPRRAHRVWLTGAVAVLAVSMLPVLAPGETTIGARAGLAILHGAVLVVTALGLLRPLGTSRSQHARHS